MARLPEVIDHTVIDAWREGGGGVVVMRDAGEWLFDDAVRVGRRDSARVLAAVAALHDAFRSDVATLPTALCPLEARYTALSPNTARESPDDEVPRLIGRGWELFAEAVADDVAGAVYRLLDDPTPLVTALRQGEPTLVHGDLKLANLGLAPDRVVMIDWGTLTGVAPAAVDLAWYLAINGARFEATADAVLADLRAVAAGEPRVFDVALVGALVQLGWNKALDALQSPDPVKRAVERAGLDWWVATVRGALDAWSPAWSTREPT
jgi:hypothetical protein